MKSHTSKMLVLFTNAICVIQDINKATKLLDCYTDDTVLEIDKNHRRFTLYLVTANNAECNVFPTGVCANLTLANTVFTDILQMCVDDFHYNTTTSLVFEIPLKDTLNNAIDITQFKDEHFSIVQLFSFAHYTEIEVMQLDELKSDLQNCFTNLKVLIHNDKIEFDGDSSVSCQQQMVGSATNPNSYISKVQLHIQGYFFPLDIVQFISDYQAAGKLTQSYINPTADDQLALKDIQTNSIIRADLQIDSMQGAVAVSLKYPIKNAAVVTIGNIFGPCSCTVSTNKYVLNIMYTQAGVEQLWQRLNTSGYTQVIYRFTASNSAQSYTFQLSTHAFDPSIKFLEVNCRTGSVVEQKNCQTFHDIEQANSTDITYLAELLVYKNDEFLFIEKTTLLRFFSCWRDGLVTYKKGELCFELTSDHTCDDMFKDKQFSASYNFYNATTGQSNDYSKQDTFQVSTQNFKRCLPPNQFLFDGKALDESIFHKSFQKKHMQMMIFGHYLDGTTFVGVGDVIQQFIMDDYMMVNYVGYVIGGIVVAALFFYTIYNIVLTHRSIKILKKQGRQLKKQQQQQQQQYMVNNSM